MHTVTDINVLLRATEVEATARAIADSLASRGVEVLSVHIMDVGSGCEPDNMLVTEYEQRFDSPPIAESLHRILVGARTAETVDAGDGLATESTTQTISAAVAAALPPAPDGSEGLWYGSTRLGTLREEGLSLPIVCRLDESG